MAHLVRPIIVNYVNADGKRVKKGTRGAKKVTQKASKWYGVGIPGQPARKRVPLGTDKEAAQRELDNLVRDAEQGRANLPDQDASRKPLRDHLKAFKADVALGLASVKGKRRRTPSPEQVQLVVQRVRDVLDGCKFKVVADLNTSAPAKLATHLRNRLNQPRTKGGISAQTADFILAAMRRFARWLSRQRIGVAAELFDAIPGHDPSNERIHARRDVQPEELAKLLDAARESKRTVRNLSGLDRYHLYLTAFGTGFRVAELASLTPSHFHLNADPPTIALPGKVAKNRKRANQVLPPGVVVSLGGYLREKPRDEPIWRGSWQLHAAKMLRVDLAAAGVPYEVDGANGKEYADFHALRHTFCSALAAAGTGAKELQTLARHSDPRLTLGLYTHARSAELVKAVNRLKVPGAAPASPLAELDRDTLEGLVLGLVVMLGSVLGGGAGNRGGSLLAPPLAPAERILANSTVHLRTSDATAD